MFMATVRILEKKMGPWYTSINRVNCGINYNNNTIEYYAVTKKNELELYQLNEEISIGFSEKKQDIKRNVIGSPKNLRALLNFNNFRSINATCLQKQNLKG